jgi:hypothetical protein
MYSLALGLQCAYPVSMRPPLMDFGGAGQSIVFDSFIHFFTFLSAQAASQAGAI